MKYDLENQNYRMGVGAMIFNNQKQIFVGERSSVLVKSCFQMPQGGIDEGETPEQALFREVEEETGISNIRIVYQSQCWYKYDFPDYVINDPDNPYGKYFVGQKQKWFLVFFYGENDEIDISGYDGEFLSWKWVELDFLYDNIISFKKKMYEDVVNEFREPLQLYEISK